MELKPKVVRLITTVTEYQCDNCKEGLMARDRDVMIFNSHPRLGLSIFVLSVVRLIGFLIHTH